jgi:hypothetical protein
MGWFSVVQDGFRLEVHKNIAVALRRLVFCQSWRLN